MDTEVHRRVKENKKLQQELKAEKAKLNSTMIKYQKEMNEMQAVSIQIFLSFYCHVKALEVKGSDLLNMLVESGTISLSHSLSRLQTSVMKPPQKRSIALILSFQIKIIRCLSHSAGVLLLV